jgi:hypothetical protein
VGGLTVKAAGRRRATEVDRVLTHKTRNRSKAGPE